MHIESDKTDVLPYKMGAAGDFLGVRTLKLGFTLENERHRQDFLVPQPISPDLRIWSPENEGGTTTRGGTTSLIPPDRTPVAFLLLLPR